MILVIVMFLVCFILPMWAIIQTHLNYGKAIARKSIDIYLACPYAHKDYIIRKERFDKINKIAYKLMLKGFVVFSPVSHSHPIQDSIERTSGSHDFWLKQDYPYIEMCDTLLVVQLNGWDKSKGISWEIEQATKLGKTISYCREEEI